MELLPETTAGSFYNRQHREATTVQFIETLAGTSQGRFGLHLYKAGVDLLHSRYSSTSASRPVLIRRSDGTPARRLDFSPAQTRQARNSTDVAVYAQDRVQPGDRWYGEVGARLDRDGVLGRFNLTPRVGGAFLLKKDGSSVMRSGYGLFFERTPSVAGVFDDYEAATDTRYAADGMTRLAAPVLWQHVTSSDMRTSRSLTWDAAFDHRFNPQWAAHVSVIDRRGRRERLLKQVPDEAGAAVRLESGGRSQYREVDVSTHYTGWRSTDINVSYVRSVARSDLNALTSF